MAHEGPRHVLLGQEHRLEAGRRAKRSALKVKSESPLATSAGTFVAALKDWEWVWLARGWQSKMMQSHQGRLTMAIGSNHGRLTVFSVHFNLTEEWTRRNQQLQEALSGEIQTCAGLWIVAVDFNVEPGVFWQFATPAAPTFRHGASVRCFDSFVVPRAVACQTRGARARELKRSFERLMAREQAAPESLPPPTIGWARKPRCWESQRDWRRAWLMRSTEQEILEGADVVVAEALRCTGTGAAPWWVTRKVRPPKSRNRPMLARDTRWWRVLSNRLLELWLMEALPARRPHLPQRPEQIERLRVHLRRMAAEAMECRDLGNGPANMRERRAARSQRRASGGIGGAGQVAQA